MVTFGGLFFVVKVTASIIPKVRLVRGCTGQRIAGINTKPSHRGPSFIPFLFGPVAGTTGGHFHNFFKLLNQ
jgi:hypothetical protein